MVKIDTIELPDFPLLLAPMEDVSDPPFRVVCKENGADLMYTEFISSEGLIRDAIKSRKKLDIFDYERPVGIQIFGGDEDSLALAAKIVDVTNPDLLDINFGCPVKKVVSKGAGAGILKDVCLMEKLTAEMVSVPICPLLSKRAWAGIMIPFILWKLLNGCKMWVVQRFLFMGVHVHRCIKALPIGGRLRRLKIIHAAINLGLLLPLRITGWL